MGFSKRYAGNERLPLWRQLMERWTPEEREEYEERAAIRQYLGGQPVEVAEKGAWEDVSNQGLLRTRGGGAPGAS